MIGGQSYLSASDSGSSNINTVVTRNFTTGWNIPNILRAETTIPSPIGFITATAGVEAGANVALSLTASLRGDNLAAKLVGPATGSATGRAYAHVGFFCANVGVSFSIKLLDTTLRPSIEASAVNGLSGRLWYDFKAVRMYFKVFFNYCFGSREDLLFNRTYRRRTGLIPVL